MQKFNDMLSKTIPILMQSSVLIFSYLAVFIFPPRMDNFSEDEVVFTELAKFILGIIIGIMYIAFYRYSEKKHTNIWWLASIVFLIAGIVTFLSYSSARQNLRAPYFDKLFVIGNDEDLTELALDLKKEYKGLKITPQEFMLNFAIESPEDLTKIWNEEGIEANRMKLIRFYLTTILLFSLSLITIIQAIWCQTRKIKIIRQKKPPKISDSTTTSSDAG